MNFSKSLMHYDAYERHEAVKRFLGNGFKGSILDVGGLSGILQSFLPDARICTLNLDKSGDVIYDGTVFPFPNRAFDTVVSLDTLEHVPAPFRQRFVRECLRVAKHQAIIAAPYGSDAHIFYESRLDNLYKDVHGSYHPWLHEHVINGLPTKLEVMELQNQVKSDGFAVDLWYAGDFERQCRIFEQSLIITRGLGRFGRLGGLYHLLASLAIWHRVEFDDQPSNNANRFYLISQAVEDLDAV